MARTALLTANRNSSACNKINRNGRCGATRIVPSIFLSYSHEDAAVVRQIASELQKAGVQVWLDYRRLLPGACLIQSIAHAINGVDYFAVISSRNSLTKSWVLTEMRMALANEIDTGRPRVIMVRLDDCNLPPEGRHKLHIDFRDRFREAMSELRACVSGQDFEHRDPKQTVLGRIADNADDELWQLVTNNRANEFPRSEISDHIRSLRSNELEGLIEISRIWRRGQFKWWEGDLFAAIKDASSTSEASARGIF